MAKVVNRTGTLKDFKLAVPVTACGVPVHVISFSVKHTLCPARDGWGRDMRELGFGLISARLEALPIPPTAWRCREKLLDFVFSTLPRIDALFSRFRSIAPFALRPNKRWHEPGLSVIIPERANVPKLHRCLESVAIASDIAEPLEIIVVVNGSPASEYRTLMEEYPQVRFFFFRAPLPFSQAIGKGLRAAQYQWVYLLNNDMAVGRNALREVLRLRSRETFAVASQIQMENRDRAGQETNWTDFCYRDGVVEILERYPAGASGPCLSLYAGGGSSLFQASLLRQLIRRTRPYEPFYWEDADWGATAWRYGFKTVFCPASIATHGYRSTIGKFYETAEITRIFERNRFLFHLRQLGSEAPLEGLRSRLECLDETSWSELFGPRGLGALLCSRAVLALAPYGERALRGI